MRALPPDLQATGRERERGSESLASFGSLEAYPQGHSSSSKDTSPDHSAKQMYSLVTQCSNIYEPVRAIRIQTATGVEPMHIIVKKTFK